MNSYDADGITVRPTQGFWKTPKGQALIEFGIGLLALGAILLVTGGHPYSNWFYVLFVFMLSIGIYRTLTEAPRPALPRNPPLEKSAALKEGILQGLTSALYFFAWMYTATGQIAQLAGAPLIGAMTGAMVYQGNRGKKTSYKPFILIGAVLLAFILFVLWKTRNEP